MSTRYSYEDIARDYGLWGTYPEDLKACPFCGCLPDCGLEDDVLMVWCDNSDCYLSEGPKFSLKAWQTRASF